MTFTLSIHTHSWMKLGFLLESTFSVYRIQQREKHFQLQFIVDILLQIDVFHRHKDKSFVFCLFDLLLLFVYFSPLIIFHVNRVAYFRNAIQSLVYSFRIQFDLVLFILVVHCLILWNSGSDRFDNTIFQWLPILFNTIISVSNDDVCFKQQIKI